MLKVNKLYTREQLVNALGEELNVGKHNTGHFAIGNNQVLLVTLNKKGHIADYEDKLKTKNFTWSSQNGTAPESKKGSSIINHVANGDKIQLFVRKNKLAADGKAAPFQYLGTCTYINHKGSKPMLVNFKLNDLDKINKEELK